MRLISLSRNEVGESLLHKKSEKTKGVWQCCIIMFKGDASMQILTYIMKTSFKIKKLLIMEKKISKETK